MGDRNTGLPVIVVFAAASVALVLGVFLGDHFSRPDAVVSASASIPAADAASSSSASASSPVSVRNECVRLPSGDIVLHALIPVTYYEAGKPTKTTSYVWQFVCDGRTKKCEGASLSWSSVQQKAELTYLDWHWYTETPMIATSSNSIAVITSHYGKTTFTIDFARGHVAYAESSSVEGRGEATCEVPSLAPPG